VEALRAGDRQAYEELVERLREEEIPAEVREALLAALRDWKS
jgi:hypothetical protein